MSEPHRLHLVPHPRPQHAQATFHGRIPRAAPEPTVDGLMDEMRAVLDRIREAHGELARLPNAGGELERLLAGLVARRQALTLEIGAVMTRLAAAGAVVRVIPVVQPGR